MKRCLCCNARLGEIVICSRCKADLSAVINSEKAAHYLLCKSIHLWQDNKTEQSLDALGLSLHLKKTKLALIFREYIIRQKGRDLLELLAQKQVLPAKQQLYKIRNLLPHSELLQQLQNFTEYLLIEKPEKTP